MPRLARPSKQRGYRKSDAVTTLRALHHEGGTCNRCVVCERASAYDPLGQAARLERWLDPPRAKP